MPIIHWFRRDLRLEDNTALWHAARDAAGHVIPVFILDDAILGHPDTGAPIVAFMLGCLKELWDRLRRAGSDLLILQGQPAEELLQLARASRASAVYYNKDYAPSAVERDMEVERILGRQGATVRGFKDQVIFEEQELLSASKGEPFTTFTPYKKTWIKRLKQEHGPACPAVLGRPELHPVPPLPGLRRAILPSLEKLGFQATAHFEIAPGESQGGLLLQRFASEAIGQYPETRNRPDLALGTSHLSPHLRHGTLSPRQCLHAARETAKAHPRWAAAADTWIGELVWRDFFQQILFNFPEVQERPFRETWAKVRWRQDAEGLERWKQGETGFPIVDAAMRQLARTGWMHNRLRMIVAMFLTKDLLIDYREGERHFMRSLIDGETAQNNGNWQWCAGSGTDAQPYFRIFNPVTQSRACDPEGAFIRQYCPELRKVPSERIHEPGHAGYPAPLVDHAAARERALAEFARVRRK